MFCAERMDRTSMLILRGDHDAVFSETARVGVLHPAAVDDWGDGLAPLETGGASMEYAKRRSRIEFLAQQLEAYRAEAESRPVRPDDDSGASASIDDALARMESAALPLLSSRDALRARLAELKGLWDRCAAFRERGLPLEGLARSSSLVSALGFIDARRLPQLREALGAAPVVVLPCGEDQGQLRLLCVTLRSFKPLLEQSLHTAGFRETLRTTELHEIAESGRVSLRDEIGQVETELNAVEQRLGDAAREMLPELSKLSRANEDADQVARIGAMSRRTETSCLFTGWTPRERTQELVDAIACRTGGRAVVEVQPTEELRNVESVPVLLKHPKFLEPFRLVVDNYGVPAYETVDPAPFVAVAFLLMFGMMFGDLGHGAVLAAAGLILERRRPAYWTVARLLTYCGVSGMIFGALFGSVFGFEALIPALWVKPIHNIGTLFKVTIGFGVALVSVGLALNIVNAVRSRTFLRQLFDLSGPLAGMAYWVGVWVATGYITATGRSQSSFGLWLFVGLLFSLSLKGPVLRVLGLSTRAFPEGVLTYVMESIIETAEFITGYLANTVSFVRVAAFGLAHAGLLAAVFGISDLVVQAPMGGVWSVLILIAGNAFVIVFEGVVVTIQILRLEYYEFFGKFFKSFGVKYAPVRYGDARPQHTNESALAAE